MALPTTWSADWLALGSGATSLTNASSYDFYIQLYLAIIERWKCVGDCTGRFPNGASHLATGRVTSISTDGSFLTIHCKNEDNSTPAWVDGSSLRRWSGFGGTFNGNELYGVYASSSYRIALDQQNAGDFNAAVYAEIVDNGPNWVKVADNGTWTLNRLLSSLVNVDFAIAARSTDACKRPFYTERRPPRPNDFELELGVITVSTTTSITDARDATNALCPKAWLNGQWAAGTGYDLMTKCGGKWKRIPITASVGNTIGFAAVSFAPDVGAMYWIIKRNAWWRPELAMKVVTFTDRNGQKVFQRLPGQIWNFYQWYWGVLRSYWSHCPADDALKPASVAEVQVTLMLGYTEGNCEEDVPVDVFDVDYQIDPLDVCNQCPDAWLAPLFWFGIRGVQIAIENLCPNFCERKTYTSETAIVNFTQATFFRKIYPANARTGTVSAVENIMGLCPDYDPDTGEPIMVPCVVGHRAVISWDSPLPKDPIAVHWVILASTSGDIITSGWLGGRNANAAGEATATTFTCPHEFTTEDVGRTIVISWGWRRRIPLEFDHLNRRDNFTPDEGDTGGVAFPPTAAHPGYWTALPKSTAYSERDRWGFKVTSLRTFTEGDAARWTGDNFADPTTSAPVISDVVPDYLRYMDRGWQGVPCYQSPVFRPAVKGTITSGTNFSFTDDAVQWWEVSGSTRADGSSVLHSGVGASGGSNTKVVVTTIADGFFAAPDYFVDQIIEVEVLSGVWESRPIEVQIADTTKSFEIYDTVPAFSHTTGGKNWRLRQAGYVRNRWIDRKVTFTKLDGTQVDVAGKWNDNKTWFTTTQDFTFEAGWKYEIADPEPGDLWHYHSGAWHRPYDAGIAQDSLGRPWQKDPAWNLPHRYIIKGDDTGGRFRVADIVDLPLLRLLFVAINALVWTAKDVSYRGRKDPAIPEWNYRPFFTLIYTPGEDACASEFARGDDEWQHETPPYVEESDGAPFAAYGLGLRIDLVGTIGAPRRYAYAVVSNLCDGMAKKVSIWGRTLIYSGSGPNGDREQPFTGCDVLTGYAGKLGLFFHTHGDFVGAVALNNWGELASSGLETGAQVVKRVGNQTVDGTVAANWNALAAMPDKAPCPPYPRGDCSITGHPEEAWFGSDNIWGYRITASKAIVKWNVPGGLKFVDVVD